MSALADRTPTDIYLSLANNYLLTSFSCQRMHLTACMWGYYQCYIDKCAGNWYDEDEVQDNRLHSTFMLEVIKQGEETGV